MKSGRGYGDPAHAGVDGYQVKHTRSYPEPALHFANVLMRMGGEHWEALEYIQVSGSQPLMIDVGDAVSDLLEWGAVTRSPGWKMQLTDFGRTILEEGTP